MQFKTGSEVHDFLEYLEFYDVNPPVEDQMNLPVSLREASNCLKCLVQSSDSVAKHWFSLAIDALD